MKKLLIIIPLMLLSIIAVGGFFIKEEFNKDDKVENVQAIFKTSSESSGQKVPEVIAFYINSYYPSLSIPYSEDKWSVEEIQTENPEQQDFLVSTDITFRNESGSIVTFDIDIARTLGGGGYYCFGNEALKIKEENDIVRYKTDTNKFEFLSKTYMKEDVEFNEYLEGYLNSQYFIPPRLSAESITFCRGGIPNFYYQSSIANPNSTNSEVSPNYYALMSIRVDTPNENQETLDEVDALIKSFTY